MDIETLHYRIADYCDNVEVHSQLLRTVERLPDDVQEFVCQRCVFLALADHGMVLPGRVACADLAETAEMIQEAPRNASLSELGDYVQDYERTAHKWIVLLQGTPSDDESIPAHEIAHAYLGHDRLAIYGPDKSIEVETQACELTRSWGFQGLGTEVDHCTAAYRDIASGPG